MTKLEEVKEILYKKNASLVVAYENGKIQEYYQNRIKDIQEILRNSKTALQGAIVADKVIGKVAASVLIVAGIKELYADVISNYAISVLEQNDVKYEYKEKVDFIINQDKTGMCPMENKYKDEKDINRIYNDMIQL